MFNPVLLSDLMLLTTDNEAIPFHANAIQRDYCYHQTHRDIIIKPRLAGTTLLIQMLIYKILTTQKDYFAVSVAHNRLQAEHLSRRFEAICHANKNAKLLPRETRDCFNFAHGNRYYIGTDFPSRRHIDILHLSEFAFSDERQTENLLERFNDRIGYIVIDTNPNPTNTRFNRFCIDALAKWSTRNNEFQLHFYEWWKDESNQRLVLDYEPIPIPENILEYAHMNQLTPAQAKWRYEMIKRYGSYRFEQMFPENLDVCLNLR